VDVLDQQHTRVERQDVHATETIGTSQNDMEEIVAGFLSVSRQTLL